MQDLCVNADQHWHLTNTLSDDDDDVQQTGQLPSALFDVKDKQMSLRLCQTMHALSALALPVAADEAVVCNVPVVFSVV